MNDTLFQAASLILPLILAIVFHEVAHGWVALMLGDPTAREQNRLTLNPLRHVDPIGTVILPGMLALAKGPIFGWAKPVPVNKLRLRHPRSGMMLVAAAGPGSNLILAGIAAVVLGLLLRFYTGIGEPSLGVRLLVANLMNFVTINLFLALFNLLPIPPFDGSHIVEGLLPRKAARAYAGFHKFGLLAMILLLIIVPWLVPAFNPVAWVVVPPVQWMAEQYIALAEAIGGR
jgi:Zn-dependent protease